MNAIVAPKNYEYKALSNLPANSDLLEVKNQTDESVDIWMTGEVGWDITAEAMIALLKTVDDEDKTVNIYVDSPGGSVFEGYAIGNYIGGMKATVNVKVVSYAASIASFIAVKADRVEMPKNSFMMIHQAWGFAMGTAAEMENTATLLRKMNEQLVNAYKAKRASIFGSEDGESFEELMAKDSWLTAEESVALGLADEVVEDAALFNSVETVNILERMSAPKNVIEAISAKVDADSIVAQIEDENVTLATEEEISEVVSEEIVNEVSEDVVEEEVADEVEVEETLTEEEISAINTACEMFDMADKANDFIEAKASIQDVKKALWKVKAAADAENETNPIIEVRENEEKDAYHNRAEKIRNSYKDALR